MPEHAETLILKFGGASVEKPEDFSSIAQLILEAKRDHSQVVVVVSAMGDMTDQLIALARQVHPSPPVREYDMLVSVGERISIALLAMALALKGVEAVSLTGSQSGIVTCGSHSEAKILSVRPKRLLEVLQSGKIAIVAGFQGVSEGREITTLGRGGSDTTAVALGVALGAKQVVFYKDVLGIFETDPKLHPGASFYAQLTYEEALAISLRSKGSMLHPRAILLAMRNGLPLLFRSFKEKKSSGTLILDERIARKEELLYETTEKGSSRDNRSQEGEEGEPLSCREEGRDGEPSRSAELLNGAKTQT